MSSPRVSVSGKWRRVYAFMVRLNQLHKPGDPIGATLARLAARDPLIKYHHMGVNHWVRLVDAPVNKRENQPHE